jgi:hypothetical protein
MSRHLSQAPSLLLLVASLASGCVTTPEEASCTDVEDTTTVIIPADLSNSLDAYVNGQCIDNAPTVDASGRVDCFVISALRSTGTPSCDAREGLAPVAAEHQGAVDLLREGPEAKAAYWNTYCELIQLDPLSVGGQKCRAPESDTDPGEPSARTPGFCYLDAAASPPIGDPQLVEGCPGAEKRSIRFWDTYAAALSSEAKSLTLVCSRVACATP